MRPLKSISLLAAVAVMAGLTACESGPEIRADGDPSANMSSYKTFAFFEKVSTDKNQYTTIVSTRLKDATRRELEMRGYQYTQTNPQLLVNFNINIQNKADVRSTPSMTAGYGYYGYRAGMYGVWGGYPQDIETIHYQEGTLSIDLVDSAKQTLVWQGVAQGRINKESVQNPGPAIDKVVSDIFARYPVPAPGVPAQK
ncbi:MAG TPA: DUF4136 domain-containing protein [Povalibacter sp.]|nr:DUF4136 domain-containing protein [Povalibacter sp.]